MGNALLYGLRDTLLEKLQLVQSHARTSGHRRALAKYDCISPVLKNLHSLPVRRLIDFNMHACPRSGVARVGGGAQGAEAPPLICL